MSVEEFFNIFLLELKDNSELKGYYRFLNNKSLFHFRKAYFCQRLQYVIDHLNDKNAKIWDIGCGYGTTGIFLSLNGYNVYGTTLEYYFEKIPKRLSFWNKYGNANLFKPEYKNIFDSSLENKSIDIIIAQDTLHHLEPLDKAIQIFSNTIKDDGKIIVSEENGNNLLCSFKNYIKRGNKRIVEFHDERLNKTILLGNENTRTIKQWEKDFKEFGFNVNNIEYVRLYPPFMYNENNSEKIIMKEQRLYKTSPLLKKYFFFGINYIAKKELANQN